MLKRFKEVKGRQIDNIIGQDRFAFAFSDSTDFYDLIDWEKTDGYQGNVITFYDLKSGDVWKPFEKKKNVVYGTPVYSSGFYYFLQCDYDEQKILLYRYIPGELLESVTELDLKEVNLYNLRIMGNGVHIVSQNDNFECYYPEKISFPTTNNESAIFIEDNKIYFESWVEEGWDIEADCATTDYKLYYNLVVRDFNGNKLSEEVGSLFQEADGTWWLG